MKKLTFIKIGATGLLMGALAVIALEKTSSFQESKLVNPAAPVKTIQTIVIKAPVKQVWQIFSDVNNWKSWQKDIPAAKLTGAFRVGNAMDWKTGGLTIHSTFHTVELYQKVGWSGKAFGSFAIHNWSFKEQDGFTTVKVEEGMEGWLVKLFKNKFQSALEPATARWLAYLKTEAEKRTQ